MKRFSLIRIVWLNIAIVSLSLLMRQGAYAQEDRPFAPTKNSAINLIQPLDDSTKSLSNSSKDPLQIFYDYFNLSWPWVIGTAAGIAVLQALIGGIMIMLGGGQTDLHSRGVAKITNAAIALLIVGLSGMILEILNPVFFVQA